MSKEQLSLLNAKDRGALREKGFKIECRGMGVTIVTCSQCNTEWSLHISEKRHLKLQELGKHFLGHEAGRIPAWSWGMSAEAKKLQEKERKRRG